MTLALLAYRNLLRRPTRTLLLVSGIALAVATALALLALSRGIERSTADSARERGADLSVLQRDDSDIFSRMVDPGIGSDGIAAVKKKIEALGALSVDPTDQLLAGDRNLQVLKAVSRAISLIALVTAGLSVLNVLLMAVQERTRETGIMMAI